MSLQKRDGEEDYVYDVYYRDVAERDSDEEGLIGMLYVNESRFMPLLQDLWTDQLRLAVFRSGLKPDEFWDNMSDFSSESEIEDEMDEDSNGTAVSLS
jgi:hypothetical protein